MTGPTQTIEEQSIHHAQGFSSKSGHATVKRYNIAPAKSRVRMEYVCECGNVSRDPIK